MNDLRSTYHEVIITQPAAKYIRITFYIRQKVAGSSLEPKCGSYWWVGSYRYKRFWANACSLRYSIIHIYDRRQRFLAKGKEAIFSLDELPQSSQWKIITWVHSKAKTPLSQTGPTRLTRVIQRKDFAYSLYLGHFSPLSQIFIHLLPACYHISFEPNFRSISKADWSLRRYCGQPPRIIVYM